MPARPTNITKAAAQKLIAMGRQIRAQRKALRISATTTAQAAGMSRVTLHRIEAGEPSVTIGAYLNVLAALGMDVGIQESEDVHLKKRKDGRPGWIPVRIRLADYPQLKKLAWQVKDTEELTPVEALNIYDRNWRHADEKSMGPDEKSLLEALRIGLEGQSGKV